MVLSKDIHLKLRLFTLNLLLVYASLIGCGMLLAAMRLPEPLPLIPLTTLLAFSFSILHAGQKLGWARAARLMAVIFFVGLAFETVGVATGMVYGPYHYTGQLGPQFLGRVPFLIPAAWTGMMYPALVIAEGIIPGRMYPSVRWLAVAGLGGLVMTGWDTALDPLMVSAGHWVWEVQGAYFGVPVQNFWGWWLTTFAALALYQRAARRMAEQPAQIPDRWAVWLYATTGASTVLGDLAFGLEGAALVGLCAMLPWVVIALKRPGKNQHPL